MIKKSDYYVKQATVLLFCGLLSLPVLAQRRSNAEVKAILDGFEKNSLQKDKSYAIEAGSTQLLPERSLPQGEEAFFVCKSSDGNGFVIVSADQRMPRILAYSEDNDFDIVNIPPNVRYWLNTYVDEYVALNLVSEVDRRFSSTADVKSEGVEPLLGEIRWGQEEPYNLLCPVYNKKRTVTGCVATAMAQVMKYYLYPQKAKGLKSYWTSTHGIQISEDFSDVEFQWNKMLNRYDNAYNDEEAQAVATLMYTCGVSVEMDYSPDGSGAYQSSLLDGYINNFGYDRDAAFLMRNYCTSSDWHHAIITELNEGRPVNYGGSNASDGGHSFVFDGYKLSDGNVYPDYHVNWGWDGRCDGYYQIASLWPKDEGEYYTQRAFSEGQQITVGIKPEDNTDDGKNYLCTANLRASSSSAMPGEKLKVYTASIYNFSYKEFFGKLSVAICDENDVVLATIGEKTVNEYHFLEGIENLSLDIVVPQDLPNGDYTLKLLSKRTDANEWHPVFSANYPTLTISAGGISQPENQEVATLGCSDVEFLMTEDKSDIYVRLYEIVSLKEKAFVGDIYMMLCDKYGKSLATISEVVHPEEMGYLDVLKAPIDLHGKITEEWPDGEYRLYFGAKHIEEEKGSYIMYYDWTILGKAPSEYYFDLSILNGVVTVNGKTYMSEPTSILPITYVNNQIVGEIYSATGQKTEGFQRGINIIRMHDGSIKKIYVK